jgi:hypothetical protein
MLIDIASSHRRPVPASSTVFDIPALQPQMPLFQERHAVEFHGGGDSSDFDARFCTGQAAEAKARFVGDPAVSESQN